MAKLRLMHLLPLVAVLVTTSAPAVADHDAEMKAFKATIRAQYDMVEQAYNNKDAESLVNKFYSEDVIIVPPGNRLSIGREQALAGYKAHLGGKARIVSFRTHLNGNIGMDWANMYVTPDNASEEPSVLKMLVLWERRKGKWISIGNMFMPGAYPIPEANTK
jgi:ketosteroid isomerase-like protein